MRPFKKPVFEGSFFSGKTSIPIWLYLKKAYFHTHNPYTRMIDKVALDCGVIWVHDRILINEMNEGALLDVETNQMILETGSEFFGNEAFGYISHRVNSYAVNPMVYRDSAAHPLLKAIAIVSESKIARENARLEQQFYTNKNAFKIFSSLDEAILWIKEIINSYSKEKSLSE